MKYDINDERSVRLKRLEEIRKAGINPYPNNCAKSFSIEKILVGFKEGDKTLNAVGRIRGLRRHGGSTFIDLQDQSGNIQIFVSKSDLENKYEILVERLDIGDFIQISGKPFLTKTGQKTLRALEVFLLSKALRPLPDKIHGLTDVEQRYRQKEIDLLSNPESKFTAEIRIKMLKAMRQFLEEENFIEVETPVLQTVAGGATAKPFITHHNALNADLYLRVSPELYLKRLIIGGFEKVYEVARCFRNEGLSPQHNPEFTQIEFYAAYWDYRQLMDFCEKLVISTFEKVKGKLNFEFDGKMLDFEPPFARVSYIEAIKKATGIDVLEISDKDLRATIKKLGIEVDKKMGRGKLIDELWKSKVRPNVHHPTFIYDYPAELSPLAKRKAENSKIVEMFQLVISGAEVVKAFTELNDPIDQALRFQEQEALKKQGDEEAQGTDPIFVEAMEYGMPPTAGAGIGIDRLAAILSNSHSIKEVILFPTLRPENKNKK
ncbi:MAG: lysine--tRNA ligase [Patescibacteria group bacterium]|jgi:lysyl-tRNA synthetase class 2